MTNRLLGQETEYAIRFSPAPGNPHPGNQKLYKAIRYGIKQFVKIRSGERKFLQEQFFVENGGAFTYEHQPYASDSGLIEGATPECSGPGELIMYQRAQESLLVRAIPLAEQYLRQKGIQGEIGLIKNCRDVKGNIYGAQENYETPIGSRFKLFFYRLSTLFFLPLYICFQFFYWVTLLTTAVLAFSGAFLVWTAYSAVYLSLQLVGILVRFKFYKNVLKKFKRLGQNLWERVTGFLEDDRFESRIGKIEYNIMFPILTTLYFPYTLCLRLLAFRRQRRRLESFLISRPIISGAGTLLEDGTFALSEKGVATKRMVRLSIGPNDRPLFDSGNLLKATMIAGLHFFLLRYAPIKQLFRRQQRLQLGLSDSNRAQFAEYLKFGSTLIVLEMAEKGLLKSIPRLHSAIDALQTIVHDPTLTARVKLRKAEPMTALEIQRLYLEAARDYVHSAETTPIEYAEIIRMWEEALGLLETDPGQLIGRLDWVSKRYLIETAGANAEFSVKKKIDIAYHELGRGYFDKLERKGVAPMLIPKRESDQAIKNPSSPERVQLRSRLIREVGYKGQRVTISWNNVRIGSGWKKKVISLADYKKGKKS